MGIKHENENGIQVGCGNGIKPLNFQENNAKEG